MKIKGLSLFSNVGIAEAYFEEIGIDIKIANEIDEKRAKFYSHLYPNTNMICGDITNNLIKEQLINESKSCNIDLVIATPPCQGMSVAGKRDVFDERNNLITHTLDIIKEILPKFVFIENVPTILKTKIQLENEVISIPDYINKELSVYYNFNEETLISCKDHSIPQMRERNIYLLVRKDINLNWRFPEKSSSVTLRDAIGDLPPLDPLLREGIDETLKFFPDFNKKRDEAMKVSKWHYPPKHSLRHVLWMMNTPSGKSAIYNEVFYPQKEDGTRIKAHHNNYRRMNWDKPSRTITQNNGVISSLCCVHPGREYIESDKILFSDARVLSIYELLIVTSLPLDWNIPTWADETLIRKVIGEGIPSLLVKKIMLSLINQL